MELGIVIATAGIAFTTVTAERILVKMGQKEIAEALHIVILLGLMGYGIKLLYQFSFKIMNVFESWSWWI